MLEIVLPAMHLFAGSAMPTPPVYPSVFGIVQMPLWAVSPLALPLTSSPAQDIYLMRYRLQVVGSNTKVNAAKMVKFKAWRNWSDEQFIRETIGGHYALIAQPEVPIAVTVLGSRPQPTRTKIGARFGNRPLLVDLGPKANFRCSIDAGRGERVSRAVVSPAQIVHRAPSACFVGFLTSRDRTCRLWPHREFTPRGVIGPGVCASRPFSILPQMGQEVQL